MASPSATDTLAALAEMGLSADQQLKVLQLIQSQNRDRLAKQRERTRRCRERQAVTVTSPSRYGNVTVTPPESNVPVTLQPANPLKVSRNSISSLNKKEIREEDKSFLFGSSVPEEPQRATASRSEYDFTSDLVPDTPGTILSFPAPPNSVAPPKDQRTALYELAKTMLGKPAGGVVSKLLKLHHDDIAAVRRVLEAAAGAVEPDRYVWKVIHNSEALLKQAELDRQQIAEWRPHKPVFPERDYSHPRQPYFVVSKVDNKKRLYLDTNKVHELVYAKADEMGVVL